MALADSLDGAIRPRVSRWVTAPMALIATMSVKDGAASRYPAWQRCAPRNPACLTGSISFCRKTCSLDVKLAFCPLPRCLTRGRVREGVLPREGGCLHGLPDCLHYAAEIVTRSGAHENRVCRVAQFAKRRTPPSPRESHRQLRSQADVRYSRNQQ